LTDIDGNMRGQKESSAGYRFTTALTQNAKLHVYFLT